MLIATRCVIQAPLKQEQLQLSKTIVHYFPNQIISLYLAFSESKIYYTNEFGALDPEHEWS